MLNKNIWKPIDNNSPGYLGKRRNQEWQRRNQQYGAGNWQIAWLVSDNLLEYKEVCRLYENAYYEFFGKRPEILEHLLEVASEVYDDDPSNIKSGIDYLKRGAVRTHIQDIAIRNCLRRLGRNFKGKQILQIRDRVGSHPLSLALSPGQVPFHLPNLISTPSNLRQITKNAWWLPYSVEDFYQRGKRICLKK